MPGHGDFVLSDGTAEQKIALALGEKRSGYQDLTLTVPSDTALDLSSLAFTGENSWNPYDYTFRSQNKTSYAFTLYVGEKGLEENVVIYANAASTKVDVPDAAWNALLALTGQKQHVAYTGLFQTTTGATGTFSADIQYGENRNIQSFASGAVTDTKTYVPGADGKVHMEYLGIDNQVEDIYPVNADGSVSDDIVWKDSYLTTNPFVFLATQGSKRDSHESEDLNGNPVTVLDPTVAIGRSDIANLKRRLIATPNGDGSLTFGVNPNLSKADQQELSYLSLYLAEGNSVLYSAGLSEAQQAPKLELTLAQAGDGAYALQSAKATFAVAETAAAEAGAAIQYQFSLFSGLDADPVSLFKPLTSPDAKEWDALKASTKLADIKNGNFTLEIQPLPQSDDGTTGLGSDGLPNGISAADSPMPVSHVYYDAKHRILAEDYSRYFLQPGDNAIILTRLDQKGFEEGGYAYSYNYFLNRDYARYLGAGIKDPEANNPYKLDSQSLIVDPTRVNANFFAKKGDKDFAFALTKTSPSYDTYLSTQLMDILTSHLDYIVGEDSALSQNVYTSNYFVSGVEFDLSDADDVAMIVDFTVPFVASASNVFDYQVRVKYTFSDIGTTDVTKVTSSGPDKVNISKAYDAVLEIANKYPDQK